MAAVALRSISRIYGTARAVDSVDLDVQDGELMVLVGPSGCGKSTVLRLIAGLEAASAGCILIGGRDVTSLEPRARDIAMVFQSYALYPHMTVAQNLGFSLKLRGHAREEIRQRVNEAAQVLELTSLLDRLPRQLSGGQRQRVALGRALVRKPQVFLLDEPLSNLDARLRASMRTEIRRLHASLGTTMIYVTHDQVEAMTLGQRIAVMDRGRLQQIDTPMRIYERPANLFVAGFLGNPSMNFLKGQASADGAGSCVLRTGEVALPLPSWPQLHGRELVVGIRPEDLRRDPPAASAKGTSADAPSSMGCVEQGGSKMVRIAATVELVEAIGNEAYIHAQAAQWPLILRTSPQALPVPGERLDLWTEVSRLHLFDARTGERLEVG